MNKLLSKQLSIRYSVYQLLFFSICVGTSGFGVTYLLDHGFQASQAGTILACSTVASCIIQPILGDVFDRLKKFILPQITAGIFICSLSCFAVMQLIQPPLMIYGLLYGVGSFLLSITNSLNNSVCAYYNSRNYVINYGVGQGIGSLSFSFASLAYGYIIAAFGTSSVIFISIGLLVLLAITVFGYPKIEEKAVKDITQIKEERVSLIVFFRKYKLFTITMVGVMLVAMCHAMAENYFIAIFEALGGGSEDVGIGFFVACLSAAPFMLFFEKIQKRINILLFLKTAGIFFILKMFFLIIATEVWHVYLIQLLQTFTYGFIFQPLYYFARQRISQADLVKGQAVAVSFYLTGTAFGGFVGGRALDLFGVDKMLTLALLLASAGTIIINVSLAHKCRDMR